MKFKKMSAKISEYNDRLADGRASEIKPEHVQKVLEKLQHKEAQLREDLTRTQDESKKTRINTKLEVARQHIARAEWLLKEIA